MGKAVSGVAAAATYVAGRIATNSLGWAQSLTVALAQIAAMKWMQDRQKDAYDDIMDKQVKTVDVAVTNFLYTVENVLLPTFKDAYPDVPQAARYVPVSFEEEQFNAMMVNIKNAPKTAEYQTIANHWHRLNYLARVQLLSPGFQEDFRIYQVQIRKLLAGELGLGPTLEIIGDEAEAALATGRVGNVTFKTLGTLNISRLRAQAQAREEMKGTAAIMEMISPVGSEVKFDDLMVDPKNRIVWALSQAQTVQNDLQNLYNQMAQKAPHKLAELQTNLQKAIAVLQLQANKANMVNAYVPNIPALYGPTVNNLLNGILANVQGNKESNDSPASLGGHLTPPGGVV